MKRYPTQGGGIVTWDEQQQAYIFVRPAEGFAEGDFMPEGWGVGPEIRQHLGWRFETYALVDGRPCRIGGTDQGWEAEKWAQESHDLNERAEHIYVYDRLQNQIRWYKLWGRWRPKDRMEWVHMAPFDARNNSMNWSLGYYISGQYANGNGGGILEWCYDSSDADQELRTMFGHPNVFDVGTLKICKDAEVAV